MTCGIYSITNSNTESMYVGQSTNIENRFKTHCNAQPIDIAIANEGVDNFTLRVIERLPKNADILKKKERYWINFYDVENNPKHYNVGQGKHPNSLVNLDTSKYTLWNPTISGYKKDLMFRRNREPNPCRCFSVKYDAYVIPIGYFHDSLSCEIINELIKDAEVYYEDNNR